MKKFNTLEEDIRLLQRESKYIPISIGEILNLLSEKGQALILILLCLPFCQPIQIPGFSTIFGIMIAFLGLRMTFGKNIWLPKKLLSIEIPSHTIKTIAEKTLIVVKKMRRFLHPRLLWIVHTPVMEIINGLVIFFLGIFLALPFPIPLTNLVSAWSIFLIALGILEDDGLFIIIGYSVALAALMLLITIWLTLKYIF